MTFNGIETEITISLADIPENPGAPDLWGHGFTGYKVVNKNWVDPCLPGNPCTSESFTYTLILENFGSDPVAMDKKGIGDYLPPRFVFMGVVPDADNGVSGFSASWGRLLAEDLLPFSPAVLVPGEPYYGEVGESDSKQDVFIIVDQKDIDLYNPCPPDPVTGVKRWQGKWEFGHLCALLKRKPSPGSGSW